MAGVLIFVVGLQVSSVLIRWTSSVLVAMAYRSSLDRFSPNAILFFSYMNLGLRENLGAYVAERGY